MAGWLDLSYRWLARHLAPGVRNSQYAFADLLESELVGRPDWLDLGCGRRPFPEWMEKYQVRCLSRARRLVGIDPDIDSLRHHHSYPDKALASGYAIPLRSQSFDLASANMVLEHVDRPQDLLREIHRVLRPGGRFVFNTPNRRHWAIRIAKRTPDGIKHPIIWILEKRLPEDVFPTFYYLNSIERIREEAVRAGFRVVSLGYANSNPVTAALGPLSVFELLWLRRLRKEKHAHQRSNILGVLEAVDAPPSR